MSKLHLLEQERTLLRDLRTAAAERAGTETAMITIFKNRIQQTVQKWDQAQADFLHERQQEEESARQEKDDRLQQLRDSIAQENESLNLAFAEAKEQIESTYHQSKSNTQKDLREARWTTRMVYEANKNASKQQFIEATHKAESSVTRLNNIVNELEHYLRRCRLPSWHADVLPLPPLEGDEIPPEPLREMDEQLDIAEKQWRRLQELALPKIFRGYWFILVIMVLALTIIFPTIWITKDWLFGSLVGTGAALFICLSLFFGLRATASAQAGRICRPLVHAVAEGRALKEACLQQATRIHRRQIAGFQKQRQTELQQADSIHQPKLEELKKKRIQDLRRTSGHYQPQLAALQARFDFEQHQIETNYKARLVRAQEKYESQLQQARTEYDTSKEDIERHQADAWRQMATAWRAALALFKERVQTVQREADLLFPPWEECARSHPPLEAIPSVLRIGKLTLDFNQLPNCMPIDPGLKAESMIRVELPALIPFPTGGNLLLRTATPNDRLLAIRSLQTLMLRYLTSVPPGKVKLTVIDPVGLGDNFAAFMHLADYDEALIAHRIWTEPAHIEQRLTDLTAHMESIIQKYLRNQYSSIEVYNAAAGEVAEPFRVLVIASFPVNFTTDAAHRLVSVISSGARCGVSAMVSVDTKQDLPEGFHLGDIDPLCVKYSWDQDQALWQDPDFADLPLTLDPPPDNELTTAIICQVGAAAKNAQRVEVPFQYIAPQENDWWHSDSGNHLHIPLGRVGATRRQAMQLGLGTAQHVLIAGKTGSGKSTLLHVLITSCALNYAPEQVELYLVDFKKGVEFKPYAIHALPHLRVVAIESEREFGLSVLQRLDEELKRRGDRFRQLGVQDIASCRSADPHQAYPRILLIVDEFQEFFTEDDRLGQEAALVLDRLVRQGRAFGIHVILGSQTIGGAYTLARSTIDQMAVRIALPCSESDGHLILSEGNSAARLLSRPGDAIYNDMSGLVEGNHPFQVAWLADEAREKMLIKLDQMTKHRSQPRPPEPIVFEGNAPANLSKNTQLRSVIQQRPTSVPKEVQAWLGEPIAIKDPTAALFRKQTGRHLVVIGQDAEESSGILCSTLISLAAQLPDTARFFLLSPSLEQAELHAFRQIFSLISQTHVEHDHRSVVPLMQTLAEELQKRQQNPAADEPPCFLFLHGAQRLRELRRAEDDFGFGSREASMTPSQILSQIIKEGAGVGIHLILTVDSLGSLLRCIDRQTLRDIELRVLFQMSSGDSSNLIDTPLASRLGLHRALFASEAEGKLEKFRPYGPPSQDWIDHVRQLWLER